MQVLFEIFFIVTAIILLANTSIGFPIKIPQDKQKMENLRKFCTLPIWYGKKHVYHSKICTTLRNVDFDSKKTTESPITTSTNQSTSHAQAENSEKYQESVENKMDFNLQNQSGSFGYISKTIYFFVNQENYEKPTTKQPNLEPLTTKSTNEAYSFLRSERVSNH